MKKLNTRKALNPAYRKHKPLRKEVNHFITELKQCLAAIKLSDENNESEEHIKEPIRNFFHNTFYKDNLINTKDRIDLAIYLDKTAKSDVGVLIEAKRPSNKAEFLTVDNLNKKALQELLLYYLRERIDNNNNNIKHLIVTNGYEWFLFKASDFYDIFYKDKALVKEYKSFRDNLKDSTKNELFYNEIAKKYIEKYQAELPFVHLDFSKTNFDKLSDAHLNTLFKIFSDVHILGHSFGNDSNQLNKTFYNELLHIIGLEEIKDKGKKLIKRKSESKRDYASLLENAIFIIEETDYLRKIKSVENGVDKAFDAGLELSLTWINRILFLKLLESQLLSYHKQAKEYRFLNTEFINGFDDLNDLFFSALAKKTDKRHSRFKDHFKYIPYLNSSLFEPNTLELETFQISALNDDEIKIFSGTVLKDPKGKKIKGELKTLDYLFKFLDAYDFTTDGVEGITDDAENKTLINASVLGLIFEKINGYKEGSFYTPGYITMYMSRETLRRAVAQKFKEQENDQIETFDDVKAYCHKFFKQEDAIRFNKIINSLRIIDPAVGSGHFLVSALNELIVIKNELGILIDAKGLSLKLDIQIENDELYIIKNDGLLFDYNPTDKESVRIQHTLFHEKQTLIENCLFGVDINPNSVKICRLRLWIELLKNAYYTNDNQLKTLPNIDINIKCGNSLISRFDLTDDLSDAFKGKEVKYSFKEYKQAVSEYKTTNSKEKKREVLVIIDEVKNNFKSSLNSKTIIEAQKKQGLYNQEKDRLNNLEQFGEKIKKADKDKLKELKLEANNAVDAKEEILNNAIYLNAFEWRFEFPEVLADDGSYVGFDVVIGNPPYIRQEDFKEIKPYLSQKYKVYNSVSDLLTYFVELSTLILKEKGVFQFIISSKFSRAGYGKQLRSFLAKRTQLTHYIDFSGAQVFHEATVDAVILGFINHHAVLDSKFILQEIKSESKFKNDFNKYIDKNSIRYSNDLLGESQWSFESPEILSIVNKIEKNATPLKDWDLEINFGIKTGYNEAFIIDLETKNKLIEQDENSEILIKKLLRGRDIQKYTANKPVSWIVSTFPSIKIDINEFPAIQSYLKSFGKRIEQTGEKGSRKKTSHHWFETQDNIAFWKDFQKPKLVWKRIGSILRFSYDETGAYCLDSTCIATGDRVKYLCAVLNSTLCNKELFRTAPKTGTGDLIISVQALNPLCVPIPNEIQEIEILNVFNKIVYSKKENPKTDTTLLENEIDQMVYKLYGLTAEEIKIVENS